MVSPALAAAAGVFITIIGYCIFFDRQRRNDPDYKKNIRIRRKKASAGKVETCAVLTKSPPQMCEPERYTEEQICEMVHAVLGTENPRFVLEFIHTNTPPAVFEEVARRALPMWREKIGF